jgi:hypothetical protein
MNSNFKNILKIIYLIFIKIVLIPNILFYKKKIFRQDYLEFYNKGYFFIKTEFVKNFYNKFNNELNSINIESLIKKNLTNVIDNLNSSDKSKFYSFSIKDQFKPSFVDLLDLFLKDKIILNQIYSRLGFKVKMNNFEIYLNHYNPDSGEEGPKLWHRDDDSIAGQLKLFFIINDLDESSGGFFYFIPRNIIKQYQKLDISDSRKKLDSWNKYRKTDEELKKVINLEENKLTYGKKNPELLIIDTNDCYHKGGHIKSKNSYRVMVMAVYSPIFNISLYNKLYKKFIFYRIFFHIMRALKNRLRSFY